MIDPALVEYAPGFADCGIVAFTTTRAMGSFALGSAEPSGHVTDRWLAVAAALAPRTGRLAYAHQVHSDGIIEHRPGWEGWLRCGDGDGHLAVEEATAMAVTLADCVPVFIAHPGGAGAVIHSGWKGTAARITSRAIERLVDRGFRAEELLVHCGPAICGRCYEVGPDVLQRLTGRPAAGPARVDLREIILRDARALGVRAVSASAACTRCDNHRFYSHRAGDQGRQIGVLVAGGQSTGAAP